MPGATGHDIVVIGASAGGIEALSPLTEPGDDVAGVILVMETGKAPSRS